MVTTTDLETLGLEYADILVGHDVPINLGPRLDASMDVAESGHFDASHIRNGAALFRRAFMQVKPTLSIGVQPFRAMDVAHDSCADSAGEPFTTRVIGLQPAARDRPSMAVLTVHDLSVKFFDGRGRRLPVDAHRAPRPRR